MKSHLDFKEIYVEIDNIYLNKNNFQTPTSTPNNENDKKRLNYLKIVFLIY
jgi:hypothetical protein